MSKKFRIIPVVDLKGGIVVRGMKGERENYEPIQSKLTPSCMFLDVLQAFHQHFGFTEFYIADLDALMTNGEKNQLSLLPRKNELRFSSTLMLDAGIRDLKSTAEVLESGVEKVIIGTETLLSPEELEDIVKCYGAHRLVISIDTQASRVISPSPQIEDLTPPEAMRIFKKTGIQEFILLQLGKVGTREGLNKRLIRDCLNALGPKNDSPETLLLGGGISGSEDLKWLADHGVGGALVATILHDGRFQREEMGLALSVG